jgi:hypothetical protein
MIDVHVFFTPYPHAVALIQSDRIAAGTDVGPYGAVLPASGLF